MKKWTLQKFIGKETIPEFDHHMKWNHSKERPPRRRVTSSRSNSPEKTRGPHDPSSRQTRVENHSRQKTDRNKTTTPAKRKKADYPSDTSDSCHSEDMEEALEEDDDTKQ